MRLFLGMFFEFSNPRYFGAALKERLHELAEVAEFRLDACLLERYGEAKALVETALALAKACASPPEQSFGDLKNGGKCHKKKVDFFKTKNHPKPHVFPVLNGWNGDVQ